MIDTRAVMRSLPLVASILGRKYGVQVEMGGADAYTDGSVIHLPALPGDVPDTLLALARGYVDHEAAHIRDTDFLALKQAGLSPLETHVWNILESSSCQFMPNSGTHARESASDIGHADIVFAISKEALCATGRRIMQAFTHQGQKIGGSICDLIIIHFQPSINEEGCPVGAAFFIVAFDFPLFGSFAYFHHMFRCGFHLNPALARISFLAWVLPVATMHT